MYDLPPEQWKEISPTRRIIARLGQIVPARSRLRFFGLPAEVISAADAGDSVEAVKTNGEEGLYRIPHGWIWRRGAHLDKKMRLIRDLSPGVNRSPAWWFVRRQKFFPTVVNCPGTVFSMLADGADNLFHWNYDVLPKLRWLPERRENVRVLARLVHPFHKACLEAAGIASSSILAADSMTLYRTDELLAAKIVKGMTPENLAWARQIYLKASESVPKSPKPIRLFISRKNATSRRVINEEDLLRRIEPHGFQSVQMEKLPLAEQLALFRDAEAIIAPTGAALAQIHLCPPDVKLLVLMPDRCDDFAYRDMAATLKLSAEMLFVPLEPGSDPDPVKANLLLDQASFVSVEDFIRRLH
jgi:Glycosyltransferase 61